MIRLAVHVTPKSSQDAAGGWRGDELSVRVSVAPEGGKANAAVCALVANSLGLAKSRVRVVRGLTSRHKVLEIDGASSDDVRRTFGEPGDALF